MEYKKKFLVNTHMNGACFVDDWFKIIYWKNDSLISSPLQIAPESGKILIRAGNENGELIIRNEYHQGRIVISGFGDGTHSALYLSGEGYATSSDVTANSWVLAHKKSLINGVADTFRIGYWSNGNMIAPVTIFPDETELVSFSKDVKVGRDLTVEGNFTINSNLFVKKSIFVDEEIKSKGKNTYR